MGIREKTLIQTGIFAVLFFGIMTAGILIDEEALQVNLSQIFLSPSADHLFGTDQMGRDMLFRTVKGLGKSMTIGLICAGISGCIAVILGIIGPLCGKKADALVSWLIDLVMSVPHTIVIILISIVCQGGMKGVIIGIALTHWTSLARVVRAETMQVVQAEYTQISRQLGKGRFYIAREHILPCILPQLAVGVILIFPHAVLHEAAITFLGFGLPAHEPAVGIILSESMEYIISGCWWPVFFPGASLVCISMLADRIGKNVERLINGGNMYVGEEYGRQN